MESKLNGKNFFLVQYVCADGPQCNGMEFNGIELTLIVPWKIYRFVKIKSSFKINPIWLKKKNAPKKKTPTKNDVFVCLLWNLSCGENKKKRSIRKRR